MRITDEAQTQIEGSNEEEMDATLWGLQDNEYMVNLGEEIGNQSVSS